MSLHKPTRGDELINRASQNERIQLIVLALTNKVGKEALEHYGISPDPDLNSDTDDRGHGHDRDTGGGRGRVEVDVEAEEGPVTVTSTSTRPETAIEVEEGIHL